MIRTGAAVLLLLLSASAEQGPPRPRSDGTLVVRNRQIIFRVPSGIQQVAPAGSSLIKLREGRGPDCINATRLMGATLLRQNSVDLILRDNSRVRARLQRRCPALDYYRGFYVTPNPDGQICADRDIIRSRMGGECGIDKFRSLKPKHMD